MVADEHTIPSGSGIVVRLVNHFLTPIIIGLLLRLLHIWSIASGPILNILTIDSAYYHSRALRIASGDIVGNDVFFMAPLYPYFMGLIYSILGEKAVIVALVQTILSGFTLWFVWKITQRLAGKKAGLIALWLGAIFPIWIYFDGVILTAALISFLNAAALWTFIKGYEHNDSRYIAAAGIFLGLSCLTRPGALIIVISMIIWMIRKKLRRNSMVFVSMVILTIIPITIRNYIVSGRLVLITASAGMNFIVGNSPQANGLYYEPEFLRSAEPEYELKDYITEAEKLSLKDLDAVSASNFWLREGLIFIVEQPLQALKLYGNKFFYFFNNLEAPNNVSYYVVKDYSIILRLFPWGFGILAAGGLTGLLFISRSDIKSILMLYFLSILAVNLLFFTSSEFRFAAVIPLLAGFGSLIFKFSQSVKDKIWDWKRVLTFSILLIFCHYETPLAKMLKSTRTDYLNFGSVSIKEGNYQSAIEYISKSLKIDPQYKQGHIALGTAYLEMGDYRRAAAELRIAGFDVNAEELQREHRLRKLHNENYNTPKERP